MWGIVQLHHVPPLNGPSGLLENWDVARKLNSKDMEEMLKHWELHQRFNFHNLLGAIIPSLDGATSANFLTSGEEVGASLPRSKSKLKKWLKERHGGKSSPGSMGSTSSTGSTSSSIDASEVDVTTT